MRLTHYEANLKTLNYAKRNMMNDWNAKLEMLATAFFFLYGRGRGFSISSITATGFFFLFYEFMALWAGVCYFNPRLFLLYVKVRFSNDACGGTKPLVFIDGLLDGSFELWRRRHQCLYMTDTDTMM
jgi:hypothetical protein